MKEDAEALEFEALLESLSKPVEPVAVSAGYKLWMGIVAIAMILLPLAYLAIIGACWYGVYLFAVSNSDLASESPFIFAGVLLVGVLGGVFMVKPLFAPRAKPVAVVELDPEEEAPLFELVEALCDNVGAPVPSAIHINADVNASASFRRGVVSMFRNDMALTIGMPLAGVLTLREFVGVLAHEFGHFSQGAGMRITYIVRSVSGWFARVVYERDGWDETLKKAADHMPHWGLTITLWIAMFLIWTTRRILWCLMWLGHLLSCAMLRQMEYDADRYEARVSGSDSFVSTADKLTLYAAANEAAMGLLGDAWRERRLGDDMAILIEAQGARLSKDADFMKHVEKHNKKAKTGMFDTHPSNPDRIASVQREPEEGVFHFDVPARDIFYDFDGLSQRVTKAQYELLLGDEFKDEHLVSAHDMLEEQRRIDDGYKSLFRFFQGGLISDEPMFLSRWTSEPALPYESVVSVLAEARETLCSGSEAMREESERFAEASRKQAMADCARVFLKAKLKIKAKPFELKKANLESAAAAESVASKMKDQILANMATYREAAGLRLVAAVRLLSDERVDLGFEDDGERAQRAAVLLGVLAQLEGEWPAFERLENSFGLFSALLGNIEGNEEHKPLVDAIFARSARLTDSMKTLRKTLKTIPYPFSHSEADATIGSYALKKWHSDSQNVGQVYADCEEMVSQLRILYFRLMSELTLLAEDVESVLGLEKLADVEPPAESEDAAA